MSHFYINIISNQNKFMNHSHTALTVLFEKPKIVSFTSLRMKNIVVFPVFSGFVFVVLLLDWYQVLVVHLIFFDIRII